MEKSTSFSGTPIAPLNFVGAVTLEVRGCVNLRFNERKVGGSLTTWESKRSNKFFILLTLNHKMCLDRTWGKNRSLLALYYGQGIFGNLQLLHILRFFFSAESDPIRI